MKLNSSLPAWVQKFQYYYDKYTGPLTRLYGFSEKDVGVYIYMLTQTLFYKNSDFVSYQISTELNKMHNEFIPNETKSRYNPRDVKESLDRLESLGFLNKTLNHGKTTNATRVKFIYSTKKIVELDKFTQDRLDRVRDEMLNVIQDLEQLEDTVNSGAKIGNSEKN